MAGHGQAPYMRIPVVTPMRRLLTFIEAVIRQLLHRRPPDDLKLGQVLVDRGIVDEAQLETALAGQRQRLIETGQAVRLGQMITDLGLASEADVVSAINETFRISVGSLSDNIRELILRDKGSLVERLPRPALPIWLKLSIAVLLIVAMTTTAFSYFMVKRQQARLFDQTVTVGTVSLNYFVNNARIPLIEEDILRLNTLIKEATATEGLRYAVVADTREVIQAHTNVDLIGEKFRSPSQTSSSETRGDTTFYTYTGRGGERILNLTRDVVFQGKQVGTVHVGVSLDFIEQLIGREIRTILLITGGMMAFGLAIAIYLGVRFASPIRDLVVATEAIGQGDYRYKVSLHRKDELGNLAMAFNQMAEELFRHSLTRQSFGKYVGVEVLEMILADPERMWLKGRKNDATILFADIRGFTAFSENRDPEEVVEMLNTFFEIATAAILEYGGYVDKFIGDAVLGVFGVPVYRRDHVERAVRAAMDLTARLHQQGNHDNPLLSSVGIGIHTGPIVSGNIGSQTRMEYTVIGDTVNLASRLSSLAKGGEVLVTGTVRGVLDSSLSTETVGRRTIKGKADPVAVFRVLSISRRET